MRVSEQDLNSLPPADKDKDMKKLLDSLPVTNVGDSSPVHQSPVHSSFKLRSLNIMWPSSSLSPLATLFSPHSLILENCMYKPLETSSKLVAATMEQNQVNRQLAISGQMLEISIPVFNGDPLQYPMWNSSFSALIDCKPMDAQTKLNFLNQYLSG